MKFSYRKIKGRENHYNAFRGEIHVAIVFQVIHCGRKVWKVRHVDGCPPYHDWEFKNRNDAVFSLSPLKFLALMKDNLK